jgi:hypothetical protein
LFPWQLRQSLSYRFRFFVNGNQWNFTGMLSTMSRCADYFRNFQNGHRCHGNGQHAKKLKNTKMIIAGYSPRRIRNRANTIYLPNLLEGHKYIANLKRVVKWPVFLTSKIILSKFKFWKLKSIIFQTNIQNFYFSPSDGWVSKWLMLNIKWSIFKLYHANQKTNTFVITASPLSTQH